MNSRLFSICRPCPEGFNFCSEFRSRDFRSAPFALYAQSPQAARDFLGASLERLAGIVLVPGERLATENLSPRLSCITISPALLSYLADFATHQLGQMDHIVSSEDRTSQLILENERLSTNNRRMSDDFDRFRASLLREMEERKAAERQLAEREELLRLIMSSTGEAIYGTDSAGCCTFANEACLDILGYGQIGEVLGRNMHDLIHYRRPDGSPMPVEECRIFGVLRGTGGVAVSDEFFYRRDGTSLPVEYSSYPILKDGGIVGAVVTWRDITERRRAEEERLQLDRQLLHAQKLESLGVLAGGIAHDFNNILMAIIGNADLALMKLNPTSPVIENLQQIEKAATRAADLAKQMLAYSGKGRFIVEQMDINALVKEMLHMLEVSISKKAVLHFDLASEIPSVKVDATQIRQIIMNLVINASEAIGGNDGLITITTGCMECDRNYLKDFWLCENIPDGAYVFLEIADSGCGMDSETLSKIFDPFFSTKFTGRGLGMAAVLGIVRGHSGAIRVCSEPGRGTTFRILLPASDRPAESVNYGNRNGDWRGSGTVLLVDDEETILGIGAEMLGELGFSAVTARDGREALEIFKSRNDLSFVILDLTMPRLDGEQTFLELRRLKPDLKVIMSSGYNEQEVAKKFINQGLAGFIQKPYKLSELKSVIRGMGTFDEVDR